MKCLEVDKVIWNLGLKHGGGISMVVKREDQGGENSNITP